MELRVPPLLLMLLFTVAQWLLAGMPVPVPAAPAIGIIAATCLLLAGLGCCMLGVAGFRRSGTTVNPLTPDAASALVSEGIYRYSRNPMYLGFLLLLLAWAAWLWNAWALLPAPLFVLWMNRLQIRPEERALLELFGDAYRDYCVRVRRWI